MTGAETYLQLQASYQEAMAECGVVFHTASSLTPEYIEPQNEPVHPAVKRTRGLLTEAAKSAPARS